MVLPMAFRPSSTPAARAAVATPDCATAGRAAAPAAAAAAVAVPFAPPAIGPEEIADVVEALESGWLSTGPRVASFERAFASYAGAPHAVAVNSCTAALHLSLLAAAVGQDDE